MSLIVRLTVLTSLLMPGLMLSHAAAEPSWEALSAHDSVARSTGVMLARLKEVRPLYQSDPDSFFTEVELALAPHIDFEGFSKGVMGKHYRDATPAQRTQFQDKFKQGLIHTYATVLAEYDGQGLVVKEPGAEPKNPARVPVQIELHTASGNVFPIQYLMIKKNDRWLLRNVIVNGVNLGLQFRSQFGGYMQQHNRDIDQVIAAWTVK